MPTLPAKKAVAKKPAMPVKKLAARPPVDDDDDEAAPARPVKKLAAKKVSAVAAGFDGAEGQKSDPNFPTAPKVKPGETFYYKHIMALVNGQLKDGPYAAVKVHWIDRKGKMSFLCPQSSDCPLCMIGDVPKFEARYNIAMLTEESPLLRTLNVGQQAHDAIRDFHTDKRTSPLSSKFYSRTRPDGKGARWKTEVFKRDGDLQDELEALGLKLHVPTDDEIAELGRWTAEDAEREINMKELQQIADEIAGDYDDDD
jgi:hypothetical protein